MLVVVVGAVVGVVAVVVVVVGWVVVVGASPVSTMPVPGCSVTEVTVVPAGVT